MKKLKYALIVSDFDGTLVNSDGTIIGEENKRAIDEYVKNGGIFAISTGRMPSGILPRVKELGLKGYVCAFEGSVVMDIESEKIIVDGKLSTHIGVQVLKKMEELELHIHVYDLWDYYCNMDDEPLHAYEQVLQKKAKLVTDKPLSEYIQENNIIPYKILAIVEPCDAERVIQILEKEQFIGCCVTKSGSTLVEVVNSDYSKGTALTYLAETNGVSIEKTIAVGDQKNDLPMLELAGLGIAVQNAAKEIKDKVVVCAYTNEQGAIAKIIETYAYEGICKDVKGSGTL